jgi:hypothetical protein
MARAGRAKGDKSASSPHFQDGQIPLGVAIFRFGIADAASARATTSAAANLFSVEAFKQSEKSDSKIEYEPEPPTLEYLTELLREQADASKVEIDREEGRFRFFFTLSGRGAGCHGGTPWEILWEPDDESRKLNDMRLEALLKNSGLANDKKAPYEGFAKVGDDEAAEGARQSEGVRLATGLVWRRFMLPAFDRAVKAGQVELYARWPLTGDDFRRLPSDIWPLLDVADWEHGVAHDTQGAIYTSIHVAVMASSQSSEDDSGESISPALHQQIRAVVKELWPSGEMPPRTKDRDAAIRDWFSDKAQTAPSDRTIRRALTEQK